MLAAFTFYMSRGGLSVFLQIGEREVISVRFGGQTRRDKLSTVRWIVEVGKVFFVYFQFDYGTADVTGDTWAV